MTPTIGRIVHFTLPGSTPNEPKVRPAIVTRVTEGASHVDLEVMLTADDVRDLRPNEVQQLKFRASVNQGKGYPAQVGEWQWPPEVSKAIVAATAKATDAALKEGVQQTKQSELHEAAAAAAEAALPTTNAPTDFAPIIASLPPEAKPTAPPPADPPTVKPTGKRR